MERALACHQCASRESAVAVRKHLSLLSHIGKMVGRHGAAPCSAPKAFGAASLQCLQPLVAIRKDRDAKAELNRRSQACEVLAGTGISRRKSIPKRTEPGARPLLRPCEASVGIPGSLGKLVAHQGSAPCIPVWKTGVYLSTLMLESWPAEP
jgi:hypothetical protein